MKDIETTLPNIYESLRLAESNRAERLKHWKQGIRFNGIEELISHLSELTAVYRRNRKLRRIAFLVERARGDFITALEATLSGFHLVTFDAMRDVMEIEFLLRDFCLSPEHIEEWLDANESNRYTRFRPAILRQRYAQHLGKLPQDLGEAADYKGHSRFLHVTPIINPFGKVGLNSGDIAFGADSGFWEMYEHGRRLIFAAHNLRRKVAKHLKAPIGPERGLKNFKRGWQATQTWQGLYMAMVEVILEEGKSGNKRSDRSKPNS